MKLPWFLATVVADTFLVGLFALSDRSVGSAVVAALAWGATLVVLSRLLAQRMGRPWIDTAPKRRPWPVALLTGLLTALPFLGPGSEWPAPGGTYLLALLLWVTIGVSAIAGVGWVFERRPRKSRAHPE